MPRPTRTPEQMRQLIKDNVTVSDTGCWEWQRSKFSNGYGKQRWYRPGRRYETRAHRVSYTAFIGEIPEGAHILHTCDNPACCNPEHLRPGTCAENMKDKVQKDRQAKGEGNGRAKLTDDAVLYIRRRYAEGGISMRALAREYDVSSVLISLVVRRKIWTHVA